MGQLPKAELHVHIEAAASADFIRAQAARYGVKLPEDAFNSQGGYKWQGLRPFLDAYDVFASVIRSEADYTELTKDYLTRLAAEGCIYAELTVSPSHGKAMGLSYEQLVGAVARGIEDARDATGIEARITITCVRHYPVEDAIEAARLAAAHPHRLVTGFGIAGDENAGSFADFAPAFAIAHKAGLGCTAHAGEAAGPESIRSALAHLPISRIGHGVRAVEDKALLAELAARGLVLEVCPSSNVCIGVASDMAHHQIRALKDAGVKVTINTDDPLYFDCTIGSEYAAVKQHCGFSDADLLAATRNAIESAFLDAPTRARLLKKLDGGGKAQPRPGQKQAVNR